jgi:hypothetical protein
VNRAKLDSKGTLGKRRMVFVEIAKAGQYREVNGPDEAIDPATGTVLGKFPGCRQRGESKAEGLLFLRCRCPEGR